MKRSILISLAVLASASAGQQVSAQTESYVLNCSVSKGNSFMKLTKAGTYVVDPTARAYFVTQLQFSKSYYKFLGKLPTIHQGSTSFVEFPPSGMVNLGRRFVKDGETVQAVDLEGFKGTWSDEYEILSVPLEPNSNLTLSCNSSPD